MITEEQLQVCKSELLNRQHELIDKLQNDQSYPSIVTAKESVGELSTFDNHPADMGTELYNQAMDMTMKDRAEQELNDINKALYAIEEGTYGICSVCGYPIPFERLLAVPTTEHCVDHAQ